MRFSNLDCGVGGGGVVVILVEMAGFYVDIVGRGTEQLMPLLAHQQHPDDRVLHNDLRFCRTKETLNLWQFKMTITTRVPCVNCALLMSLYTYTLGV